MHFGGREISNAHSVCCLDGKVQCCLLPSAQGAGPVPVWACRACSGPPPLAGCLPALPCIFSVSSVLAAPTLPQRCPGASGPAPVLPPVASSPLQCSWLCPDDATTSLFHVCDFSSLPSFCRGPCRRLRCACDITAVLRGLRWSQALVL